MPWGKDKEMVTAMTVDSMTKQWVRRPLGHPILSENATQAFCRDLLALGLIRCEAAGYRPVLHVHDEIVAEVPEGWGSVEEMEAIMSEVPKWAEGMPISAEGYRAKRYKK
jgi:DNA polymerase